MYFVIHAKEVLYVNFIHMKYVVSRISINITRNQFIRKKLRWNYYTKMWRNYFFFINDYGLKLLFY